MRRTTFVILCLEAAVLSFNLAAVSALVPSIANDFALSQFFVGKIIWMYMLTYGIAALIYGPLVKRFCAKKIELLCLFFFSGANLIAALSQNIYTLFVARFLMGLFGAFVIPLSLILIARNIDTQKRGRFVGIFFSATFIASLLGLLLSGLIHWRLIFLIPAIFGFILCVHVYFYLPNLENDKGSPAPLKTRFLAAATADYLAVFRNKSIALLFAYIFCISLIYHGIQQWLAVYFSNEYGFGQFVISMLITLTSLSGIFGEAIGGALADLLGRLKTVNLGIVLMLISVALLLLRLPLFILALIMLIWGLGWTFNHAGLSTVLTDLPDKFLYESASLNSSVRFLSGGIGAHLGGLILQKDFNLGFMIFGAGLLLVLVFCRQGGIENG